ncbi:signal peptidase I [Acinetobacter calcoaceticus]|uniref:Signal peptidase I n=1 Tax=Acinetobacter calcoaceticus TaxID=471 RepID=A0A4R1XVT0_ACICA|nr:signal peptidase I [Acinetobacter calcoaceticus]
MDFDFNLILVPVTLIFFLVWLLDKLVFKQRSTKGKQNENFIITWAYDFWPVLAVVLVLRSFLFEPFNIPSDSMVPTLETGDYILVNKFAYGVRLPISNGKIISVGEPQHGDVAVFRYPLNPKISYIKRIIGLPGDTVKMDKGELFINGVKQEKTFVDNIAINAQNDIVMAGMKYKVKIGEHQFNQQQISDQQFGPEPEMLLRQIKASSNLGLTQEQSWEVKVPQGQYFAMGDNRDQSSDSRYWGFVPEENLIGHAIYVWMHKQPGLNLPSFGRNGAID